MIKRFIANKHNTVLLKPYIGPAVTYTRR